MARRMPELISENDARTQWNSMSRSVKEHMIDKLKTKIHSKDVGQAQRYYYGNLYPKTKQAIRRSLSGR